MPGSGTFRGNYSMVLMLALLVAIVMAGNATVAEAGVVTYWSTLAPSGDVPANRPIIVCARTSTDANPLVSSSLKLYVDGVEIPRAFYSASIQRTYVYVYYIPSPELTDGVHMFRVQVADSAGKLSYREWSARIVQPPKAAWVSPVTGSKLHTGSPSVVMSLSDNTPETSFTVAGQVRSGSSVGPVLATFGGAGLSAGRNSFTLPSELPFGTYYLTATVTDAAGNHLTLAGATAGRFTTVSSAPMTVLEDCDSCHAGIRNAHPTPTATDCMVCHPGYDGDHMEGTDFCEDCHWDGWHDTSVAVTSSCTQCHTPDRSDVPQHTAANTSSAHSSSCGGCHVTTLLATHGVTPDGSSYPYQCDVCHSDNAEAAIQAAVTDGDTTCSACHFGDPHSGFSGAHTHSGMEAGCQEGCHTNALVEEHTLFVGADNRYPQYADTCALCHANEDANRVPAVATADCWSCHESHGDLPELHTSSDFTGYADLVGAVNPANELMDCQRCHGTAEQVADWAHYDGAGAGVTVSCSMCHTTSNLVTLHSDNCALCHASGGPRASFSSWNQGCQQGDCHPTLHPDVRAGHDLVSCYDCHVHFRTFDFSLERCGVCHTLNDTAPPVTSSDVKAIYVSSATVALSAIDSPGIGGAGLAHTYYVLDGGPQIEGSSVFVPGPAVTGSQLHVLEFWSVDGKGNTEARNVVTFTVMNVVDTSPPSGTMSVNDGAPWTMIRYATLNSNVVDAETGVWQMRIDPATGTFGSWVDYSASCAITLPNGTGTKTVRAEYKDWAGNVRQITDTIILDQTAPVTSSDVQSNYTGSATITLSATDVGSGVARTHYILDGGPQMEGTTVSVPGPSSGSESHTLEFWSVDNSGRVESRHAATFYVLAPAADVGTIELRTGYPNEIDWCSWEVRAFDGSLVASGESYGPVPNPIAAVVPVSTQPYTVIIDFIWYGTPESRLTSSALIDTKGGAVTIWYN